MGKLVGQYTLVPWILCFFWFHGFPDCCHFSRHPSSSFVSGSSGPDGTGGVSAILYEAGTGGVAESSRILLCRQFRDLTVDGSERNLKANHLLDVFETL